MREGLQWYDLAVSIQNDQRFWKFPKVQFWKKSGLNLRVGWRYTAFGIHLSKAFLPDTDVTEIARNARSTEAVEGHTHLWPDSGAGLRDRADTACTVCGKRWMEAKSTEAGE